MFSSNTADIGGAICNAINSIFIVSRKSLLAFYNNTANSNGGALFIFRHSVFLAEGNSTVLFKNNTASDGGAIYSVRNSFIIFLKNAFVAFHNNVANSVGGGAYIVYNSQIAFKESSKVVFNVNIAVHFGVSISVKNPNITIEGNAFVTFNNGHTKNSQGGSIYFYSHSVMLVSGNSLVGFYNNTAMNGGAIGCMYT